MDLSCDRKRKKTPLCTFLKTLSGELSGGCFREAEQ